MIPSTKKCFSCLEHLPLSAFAKNCRKRDGLDTYCRACTSKRSSAYHQKNRERRQLQQAEWLKNNPGKNASYSKAWRERNPGKQQESERRWYEANREAALRKDREQRLGRLEAAQACDRARYWADVGRAKKKNAEWRAVNKGKVAAYASARRAAVLKRAPPWLTEEDWDKIFRIYEDARRLSEATGVLHHVDHEVPLRGKRVSGLHVPGNLRCLPAKTNLSKSNRFPV